MSQPRHSLKTGVENAQSCSLQILGGAAVSRGLSVMRCCRHQLLKDSLFHEKYIYSFKSILLQKERR